LLAIEQQEAHPCVVIHRSVAIVLATFLEGTMSQDELELRAADLFSDFDDDHFGEDEEEEVSMTT
jgi:hypothetical protein